MRSELSFRAGPPIALQLSHELRKLIEDGQLAPGSRIPSEAQIVEQFGVARGTAREALKLLEESGLIEVQHGRGRFVSAIAGLQVVRPITVYESATEMLAALGYRATTRVLSVEQGPPTTVEAAALDLPSGADVVRLTRVRLRRSTPLIVSLNVFGVALLDGVRADTLDFSGSLNDWLAARGHELVSSAAQVQAVFLPGELAAALGVEDASPWLAVFERCVDRSGRSVLFSRDYHRGDVFQFNVLRRRTS